MKSAVSNSIIPPPAPFDKALHSQGVTQDLAPCWFNVSRGAEIARGSLNVSEPARFPRSTTVLFLLTECVEQTNKRCQSWRNLFGLSLYRTSKAGSKSCAGTAGTRVPAWSGGESLGGSGRSRPPALPVPGQAGDPVESRRLGCRAARLCPLAPLPRLGTAGQGLVGAGTGSTSVLARWHECGSPMCPRRVPWPRAVQGKRRVRGSRAHMGFVIPLVPCLVPVLKPRGLAPALEFHRRLGSRFKVHFCSPFKS